MTTRLFRSANRETYQNYDLNTRFNYKLKNTLIMHSTFTYLQYLHHCSRLACRRGHSTGSSNNCTCLWRSKLFPPTVLLRCPSTTPMLTTVLVDGVKLYQRPQPSTGMLDGRCPPEVARRMRTEHGRVLLWRRSATVERNRHQLSTCTCNQLKRTLAYCSNIAWRMSSDLDRQRKNLKQNDGIEERVRANRKLLVDCWLAI